MIMRIIMAIWRLAKKVAAGFFILLTLLSAIMAFATYKDIFLSPYRSGSEVKTWSIAFTVLTTIFFLISIVFHPKGKRIRNGLYTIFGILIVESLFFFYFIFYGFYGKTYLVFPFLLIILSLIGFVEVRKRYN